jgi:DNA (cytosine-5)-methyltransferase 1
LRVYYNEIDPYCVGVLRVFMENGEIPHGHIDTRSIEDVVPSDLEGFDECHFFAGIGVWAYALKRVKERENFRDGESIWTGSAPCQPFSKAGARNGFDDERHLWPSFHHLIRARKPTVIFGEQVKDDDWIDLVHSDVGSMGYAFGSVSLPAAGFGAPHVRDRAYWVADAEWREQSWQESCRRETRRMGREQQPVSWDKTWKDALAEFRVLDDGISRNVAATDAIRNALVAPVAIAFIEAFLRGRD